MKIQTVTARPRRVLLSWSSGKDSAWSLHALQQTADIEVVGLLTTFNESADRVAMHAVRRTLVREQAKMIGLPLVEVALPWPCTNEDYERAMSDALVDSRERFDVSEIAFGDLFLEDIRRYRDNQLAGLGLEAIYPLWQLPTRALAHQMIEAGVGAVLTCVDPKQCPIEFVGRRFDAELLNALPESVDPCGENGEFHTFVFDTPDFRQAIPYEIGRKVERGDFVYCDVRPKVMSTTTH
ncbi:MAG: ATP-binding protein [Pseudomonadota bacterium]